MLSAEQDGIKYYFWLFGMTRPGIEPRSPGPLANTLLKTGVFSIRLYFSDEALLSLFCTPNHLGNLKN